MDKNINDKIEEKREELHGKINEATKKGIPLCDENILKASRELDKLIIKKMREQIK